MGWRTKLRIFLHTPRRAREAWLVLIGKESTERAYRDGYQSGFDDGIMCEREVWQERTCLTE